MTVCKTGGADDNDHRSTPLVNSVITESLDGHNKCVSGQKEQEQLSKLFYLLKINESSLENDQLCLLRELISENIQIFLL